MINYDVIKCGDFRLRNGNSTDPPTCDKTSRDEEPVIT